MDKRFLTAFLNPPKYVVGGIELDFFCPRHFITLQAVDSPFLQGANAKGVSFKDLFIALRICSTKNWIEAVKKPSIKDRIKYYILEGVLSRQVNAYAQFGHYISESMTVPKVWVKEDNSSSDRRPTNLPETLSMATILMTKFGFSEEDAWNMPFAKAVWYATAFGGQEGGEISIITTDSEENEKEDLAGLGNFEENIKKALASNQKRKDIKVL